MTAEPEPGTGPDGPPPEADVEDDPTERDPIETRSGFYHGLVVTERVVAVALFAALFLTVLLQVFTRYVLGTPLTWTEEIARYLLIWTTFVAAAYVSARRLHISVDLLVSKLGERGALVVDVFAGAVVVLTAGLLTVASTLAAKAVVNVTSPATDTPMWLVYASAVIGFGLITIHSLIDIVAEIRHRDAVPRPMEGIEKGSAF